MVRYTTDSDRSKTVRGYSIMFKDCADARRMTVRFLETVLDTGNLKITCDIHGKGFKVAVVFPSIRVAILRLPNLPEEMVSGIYKDGEYPS